MGENNTDLRETHIIGPHTREQIVAPHVCPSLGLYGIELTGLSSALPPFRMVRLTPNLSHLLVCVSGSGVVWLGDRWAQCEPGEAYVMPPGTAHGYYAPDETPWQFAWIHFLPSGDIAASRLRVPTLLPADPPPVAAAIQGLYRESLGAAEPPVLHHWTHLVSVYAQRVLHSTGADSRLRVLWEMVDARLSYPWTVEELAKQIGTSGEHLRRLCRTGHGRSPLRHVTFLRMRRAAALLSSHALTVEAVAAQVGYENPFAFSTAFKRHIGLTPSDYRNTKTQQLPGE